MHIRPFQAVFPRMDYITSPESFFGSVKEEYPDYVKSGFFRKTGQEGIYIYQIQDPNRNYTGVIACSWIEDYLSGHIKKHEHTLAAKEQQQLHLLLRRKAMVKPILLTYRPVEAIEAFVDDFMHTFDPIIRIEFEEDEQTHLFWEITDGGQIQLLQALFDQYVPHTYIADGHHRTSTTAIMYDRHKNQVINPYDKLFSAFFPTSQLDILDYNRILEGLNDLSPASFMAKLSQVMDIEILEGAQKPDQKHEMVMYLHGEWYKLNWRPKVVEEYAQHHTLIDAGLLNEFIIEKILGIKDARIDLRIKYVDGRKGIEGLRSKIQKSDERIGFLLYPVGMKDFLAISNAEKVLPPKSTWFEPRMRNGLIVQDF